MSNYPLKSNSLITADDYQKLYLNSTTNPEEFWAEQATQFLDWEKPWDQVKDAKFSKDEVFIKWFAGGQLNASFNCLDRHLATRGDKIAIYFEPDAPTAPSQHLTYLQLHKAVCKCANMLLSLGIKPGDRVTIYMPMIIETVVAMLAIARIGAIHSVVFGGFSPNALASRIIDSSSKLVITADEGNRGGKKFDLKANVDLALKEVEVEAVLIVRNTGSSINFVKGRDLWWHELFESASDTHKSQSFPAEHPLFILYTSGSTGQPKGLLHTTAGYLLYAATTFKYVFDYQDGDIYWCTADVGWITGHSYIVYGPLCCGASIVIYEGVPNYPDSSRIWQIIDKYKITQLYTSPTLIRMLMRDGDEFLQTTDRTFLKVLGSVGEPINPEAWLWYFNAVGKGRCQIVDTWWQTETGGHLITPIPGATHTKPGSATLPFFGIQPCILDTSSNVITKPHQEGALCIKDSWPGQARTIWNDHERFIKTYFASYDGYYFSGDAARQDDDGYFWIAGRMDDVINVSGHRIGTAEVEAALNKSQFVAESAVVGFDHDIKGQAIYAFIILNINAEGLSKELLQSDIVNTVKKTIGSLATPQKIQFVTSLPKTRSGKIMRRILRKIANGEITDSNDITKLGDISTLLDPGALNQIILDRL